MTALRAAVGKYTAFLEPHQLPEGEARRARPPLTLH
jgi:hypothetical protein